MTRCLQIRVRLREVVESRFHSPIMNPNTPIHAESRWIIGLSSFADMPPPIL